MPGKNKQEVWTAKQAAEHLSKQAGARMQGNRQKYNNVKSVVDGITFDSAKEAKQYGILKMRQMAGNIRKFECHVVYPLIVKGFLICNYEADFVVYHIDGSVSVQDVKSAATEGLPVFQLKKKLMWAIHKIKIQIVN
jgi:Protein of unknown function (DUF1064)